MFRTVAVNEDGSEVIAGILVKNRWNTGWINGKLDFDTEEIIPKGTIKKLIGHELTWEDDPVKVEIDIDTPDPILARYLHKLKEIGIK